MSGRYLLDTNIIIALFADEVAVKNRLVQADEVFIPSIAIGELCYGARKSGRSKENLERIDEFIANNTVVGCDAQTARYYGEIKNNLYQFYVRLHIMPSAWNAGAIRTKPTCVG
jgi:tRNA(fMet)-specific endonuclease VapC